MRQNRRQFIRMAAVTGVATGLAGCSSEGGDGGDGGDGSDGGNGGDSQYSEFDPENPEFPQLFSTLVDAGFDEGNISELEGMESRDEPRYGDPPQQLGSDEEPLRPDPLVFTWAPTEDPAGYEDTFEVLRSNFESELDVAVETFVVQDYAAQVEAMRAERLHLARFSTGNTPFGVNLAGAQPFAMPIGGGKFGVKTWTITQEGNDSVNGPEDLADLDTVAHGSETSNSGNLAPSALLPDEGVVPGEDYEITFTGSHGNTALAIANEDHEAGNGCSTCMRRAYESQDIDMSTIKVVWSSPAFPLGPFSFRYNLAEDMKEGIRTALFGYDYSGTALEEDIGYDEFVEIDYATHFDNILQIQEYNEVEYEQ